MLYFFPKRKLTTAGKKAHDEIEIIKRRLAAGDSVTTIAKDYGMKYSGMYHLLIREKIEWKAQKKVRW